MEQAVAVVVIPVRSNRSSSQNENQTRFVADLIVSMMARTGARSPYTGALPNSSKVLACFGTSADAASTSSDFIER